MAKILRIGSRSISLLVTLFAVAGLSYIILNHQGAVAIIEKLTDITQTPFPS